VLVFTYQLDSVIGKKFTRRLQTPESNQGNHRYLEAQLIPARIVEGGGLEV